MPYTPAHAIATVPIWYVFGQRLPVAALVVGSLSPDFPYLLALTPVSAPGHTLIGLVPYCLVPSMIILGIWYRWLEKPILSLVQLPSRPRRESSMILALYLTVAVLIGAATHAAWDSSSHATGWLVQRYMWLRMELFGLPVYTWNQYLGGILGLSGLAVWYWIARRNAACVSPTPKQHRAAAGIFSALVFLFVCVANLLHNSATVMDFAVRSAVGVLVGLALGSVVYAVWAHREANAA